MMDLGKLRQALRVATAARVQANPPGLVLIASVKVADRSGQLVPVGDSAFLLEGAELVDLVRGLLVVMSTRSFYTMS